MRIIGGRLRGLKLASVGTGDAAAHLRPTPDRVREAVFNLLANPARGDRVTGARVLDLFAGTGAMAIEALSRGAAAAVLVDDGVEAGRLIARNLRQARLGPQATLIRSDATQLGPNPGAPFPLVFLDPPYGLGLGEAAVAAALRGGWIAPGTLVVWEEGGAPQLPPALALRDQRRYGSTVITLCETS